MHLQNIQIFYFCIEVQLIYNVVPISAVQKNDPDICVCIHVYIYIYIYIYTHSFSHIIFHHVQSQEVRHNSLCSTAGPYGFPILNAIVCIYQPQTPCPSHFLLSPSLAISLFSIHESISVLQNSFDMYLPCSFLTIRVLLQVLLHRRID